MAEALTLDAALDKALEGTPPEAPEPGATPAAEEPPESLEASENQEEASTEGEETPETPEPLEAPAFWKAEQREAFGKLPRDQQEFLLERDRTLTGEFTRKAQELSRLRQEHEGIEAAIENHRERIDLEGINPGALLDRILSWQGVFEENPVKAISWLANTAGMTLSQLAQMEQQQQSPVRVDPAIQQLWHKMSAMEQLLQEQRDSVQQAEVDNLESQVQSFAEEKDSNGKLLRPYVNEVLEDMLPYIEYLARANPERPVRDILDTAYAKAIRANEGAFKKIQDQERIAKAKAAKNAGSSIVGGPGGQTVKQKPKTLDDALELAMSQNR